MASILNSRLNQQPPSDVEAKRCNAWRGTTVDLPLCSATTVTHLTATTFGSRADVSVSPVVVPVKVGAGNYRSNTVTASLALSVGAPVCVRSRYQV